MSSSNPRPPSVSTISHAAVTAAAAKRRLTSSSTAQNPSTASPSFSAPRAPAHFSSSATIADTAQLTGSSTISIGTESVVHARAKLESLVGPVSIARRCIVAERSTVGATPCASGAAEVGRGVVTGDYVTIETGAVVEAGGTVIGDGTVVGVGTRVGMGAVIGKYCTLTPNSAIAPREVIPDYTIVFSNGMRRKDKRGVENSRQKGQARQIEALRRIVPSNPARFL